MYSIVYAIVLILFAIGLFYLAYRVVKAEKDVLLEILRYVAAVSIAWLAVCSIVAAFSHFSS